MTVWPGHRRESRAPALAAALILHAALLLGLMNFSRPLPLPIGTSVPINIVSSGPTTNARPAEQAPVAQAAQVETPVPAAPPPRPAPPAPAPKPEPARAAPPRPAPPKPVQQRFSLDRLAADLPTPKRAYSLSALQADIDRSAGGRPSRPASARRGPTRAETASEARVDAGTGVSQSDVAGLSELLERLWNPDCTVENRVVIPVRFTVAYDGEVQGRVDAGGRERSSDPVVFALARRAIDAVHQAAPYAQTYRGLTFTVNFNTKAACAQRN